MAEILDFDKAKEEADLCDTVIRRDMAAVFDLARNLGSIALVVGSAGIGKTTAVRWIEANRPGVLVWTADATCSNNAGALAALLRVLGIPSREGRTAYGMRAAIVEWSDWKRSDDELALIVDEAQHLGDQVIDTLRGLYDELAIPLVLVGNQRLRDRFGRTRTAAFSQLTSRATVRRDYDGPCAGDVAAFARHCGVDDAPAVAFLERHATAEHGLRHVRDIVAVARGDAGDGPVRLGHLKSAVQLLGLVK